MTDNPTRRALFLGGPRDGDTTEVALQDRIYRAPVLPDLDRVDGPLEHVTYDAYDMVDLDGRPLRVFATPEATRQGRRGQVPDMTIWRLAERIRYLEARRLALESELSVVRRAAEDAVAMADAAAGRARDLEAELTFLRQPSVDS
jgi:hypothetical protein